MEDLNQMNTSPDKNQDSIPAESDVPANNSTHKEEYSAFDSIADFFKRMTIGILKFAFVRLPVFIWNGIKYLFREWRTVIVFLKKIWRMVFWFTTWVVIVFAAWLAFGLKQFIRFWTWVGSGILSMLTAIANFVIDNAGPIWLVIALIGSAYGLFMTVRLKRITLKGILDFFKRKNKHK